MSASLKRSLNAWELFSLAFGAIIGVGWIILVGQWLADAGPLNASLVFLFAGICLMAVGWCYAELVSRYPLTGGEFVFASQMFGDKAGFIVGWFLALSLIAVVTFEVVSVAWILRLLFNRPPEQSIDLLGIPLHVSTVIMGAAVTALITFVNYRGGRIAIRLQDIMNILLIIILIAFVMTAVFWGDVDNYTSYAIARSEQGTPFLYGSIAVLATAPFLLTGFNMIPQGMGEVGSFKPWQMHKIILLAIGMALIFYMLIIIAVALSLPQQDLQVSSLPAAYAFEKLTGHPVAGKLILIAGLLGLLTTWNAVFFAASRLLYTMGKEAMLPPSFASVSRGGAPAMAALFVALISLIFAAGGRAAINPVINVVSVIQSAVMAMVCYLALRLALSQSLSSTKKRIGVIVSIFGFMSAIIMMAAPIYEAFSRRGDALPMEFFIFIMWSVLGLLFWHFYARPQRKLLDLARGNNKT